MLLIKSTLITILCIQALVLYYICSLLIVPEHDARAKQCRERIQAWNEQRIQVEKEGTILDKQQESQLYDDLWETIVKNGMC